MVPERAVIVFIAFAVVLATRHRRHAAHARPWALVAGRRAALVGGPVARRSPVADLWPTQWE
ncbi:hypothetical protein [Nonomuraea sp. CA-141351]|uniref:hypothetical protein n=1 Tax=Nonomuraea sp. CA-141351 TaxID=3239996 RepID=UPI003D9043BC